MGTDLKNKTIAIEYAFKKNSRGSVGNVQKGICNYICLQIDV
jgi:hypothetical protein